MLGSPVDLALIAGVALMVFGPKRLPEMGRSLGLGLASFKNGLNQGTDALQAETKNTESKVNGNPKCKNLEV
jgi:sec-independent protein translocase protein TatA